MSIYFVIHISFLILHFIFHSSNFSLSKNNNKVLNLNIINNIDKLIYLIILIFLIIFVGLRHEVGGDWKIYLRTLLFQQNDSEFQINNSFFKYIFYEKKEFLYRLISYFAYRYNFEILGSG